MSLLGETKKVVDFSPVGFKALQRATFIEAERRFCGNKTEEVDGSSVTLNGER